MTEREELAALIDQVALAWESDVCLLGNMTAAQLARAAALLRESRPQPGWQPISTAPTDGTEVLASDHYAAIEIVSWSWDAWETGSGWIDRDGRRPYPAWWQPLPEDPPIPTPTEPTTTETND